MSSKSREIAIGGVSAALSLTILFMTGLVPFSSYCLPALAGFFLIPVTVEMGFRVALTVYGAAALLAPFIVPDYEASMMFVVLMGYYPIIRPKLQRIPQRFLRILVKLLIFNCTVVAGYSLIIRMFGMQFLLQDSSVTVSFALGGMLLTGNIIFVFYDLAIQNLYRAYIFLFRKRIFGKGHL